MNAFTTGTTAPIGSEAVESSRRHARRVPLPLGEAAPGRIPELDGLRGLAILLVILCHYISNSIGGESRAASYFSRLFSLGWSGVDLFFVLSGFLIGGILLDARDSPRYFKTFYLRRVHRILPIYFLWVTLFVVVSFLAAKLVAGSTGRAFQAPMPAAFYYFFLQNLVFVQYAGLAWYWLSITWSLAVEEQFYLVAPPLIRFLNPAHLVRVAVACIVFSLSFRILLPTFWENGRAAAYILMPARADALALGVLLAVLWRRPAVRSWFSNHLVQLRSALFVLFLGVLVLLKWFPAPDELVTVTFGYTWLALFYSAVLVLALLNRPGILARLTRWRPLRELGAVSYSVYLIHFLVLAACHRFILGASPRYGTVAGALVTLLAAALTYGLAKISWVYFEHPLIRRGQRYSYWPEVDRPPQEPIVAPQVVV